MISILTLFGYSPEQFYFSYCIVNVVHLFRFSPEKTVYAVFPRHWLNLSAIKTTTTTPKQKIAKRLHEFFFLQCMNMVNSSIDGISFTYAFIKLFTHLFNGQIAKVDLNPFQPFITLFSLIGKYGE